MLKTLHIKSLVVGALLGFAGVLAGEGIAHADCDYEKQPNHTAYELAFAIAEETCDYMSQGWLETGLNEVQVEGMYDACMRLSVPPMVLTPAQHYDMTDGAFWRTTEGN